MRKLRCCETNALGVHTYGMSSISRSRYDAVERLFTTLSKVNEHRAAAVLVLLFPGKGKNTLFNLQLF